MPVVPTLNPAAEVTPNQAPDTQATSNVTAGLLDQGAVQQAGQLSDALGTTANATSQIAIDAQNLANQTRVNDAVNQLKTTQQNLMYDPQSGVVAQTGINAIQRSSGMSLADEYTGKLNDTASQISQQLTPVQQRLFDLQSQDISAAFHGATTQWEGQQFKQYALSTQDGTIKNAVNQASLAYNDPNQIDNSLQAINAAVFQAGKINGAAATEIEANQRTMTSTAVSGAIDAALQKGQITYANGLVQKYGPQMSANDLLAVNGKMNTYLGTQAAMNTVTKVMSQAGPQLSNSPFDRMVAITQQAESSNNPNAVGPNVPGQGTAKGAMQVMDATAANPGYGVRPSNGTPQDTVREGRDYLQAMLGNYGGDMAKAWAAYQAGPATVDAAVKTAQAAGTPGTWLTNMPTATQTYVQQNVNAYNSSSGVANRPSKLDVINQVRQDPTLQAKPEWMAQAVTLAGQQYDEQTGAIAQTDTANKAGVMRTLDANRGNINSVSPADLAKLNPSDLPDVLNYAKSISEGTNSTNTALYQTLVTTPKMMSDMSNDQWQTQAQNFSVDDFKHLSQMRADLINNTGANSPGSVNLRAVNETLTQRLQSMGINPYPKAVGFNADPDGVSQVGAIRQFVNNSLISAQQAAGKKFSESDIENHIDGLFAKTINVQPDGASTLWGLINKAPVPQNMMSMTPDDIPSNMRKSLTADFASHGIKNPTPGQLLGAYWQLNSASKQAAN